SVNKTEKHSLADINASERRAAEKYLGSLMKTPDVTRTGFVGEREGATNLTPRELEAFEILRRQKVYQMNEAIKGGSLIHENQHLRIDQARLLSEGAPLDEVREVQGRLQ